LPKKALLKVEGFPLIHWVVKNAQLAESLESIWVATDNEEIAGAARVAGANAVMTRADHATGSDRIAEVAESLSDEIIINIQGDEPEIAPATIDAVADLLKNEPDLDMATAAVPIIEPKDWLSPHRVKVVCDSLGRALYFSRSPIPYNRCDAKDAQSLPTMPVGKAAPWGHLGIYAYRRAVLLDLVQRPTSPLEGSERLEQLRALQGGMVIGVACVNSTPAGIDTAEDLEAFRQRARQRRGE